MEKNWKKIIVQIAAYYCHCQSTAEQQMTSTAIPRAKKEKKTKNTTKIHQKKEIGPKA